MGNTKHTDIRLIQQNTHPLNRDIETHLDVALRCFLARESLPFLLSDAWVPVTCDLYRHLVDRRLFNQYQRGLIDLFTEKYVSTVGSN